MGVDVVVLENVLGEFFEEIKKQEESIKAAHGRFNLFTVLLNEGDEVRLHTRFLTHLLDPKGTHDCGNFFLNRFLGTVGLNPEELGECRYVANEYCTGNGNIDIFAEFENACIVIENKIWAGDQDEQLKRYYDYSSRIKDKVYMFYLTLDGHKPSKEGTGDLSDDKYSCLSYKKHILDWLEECRSYSDGESFSKISQALAQYGNVVNNILGNRIEAKYMKTVKDMLKDKFNNEQLCLIQQAINQIIEGRKEEVKNACKESFGFDVSRVDTWSTELTAFRFYGNLWGETEKSELVLIMDSNGTYSLRAYATENSRLKKTVESDYSGGNAWEPEKSYAWKDFFGPACLNETVEVLKTIIDKLKSQG